MVDRGNGLNVRREPASQFARSAAEVEDMCTRSSGLICILPFQPAKFRSHSVST
jgi:hypothetical protein